MMGSVEEVLKLHSAPDDMMPRRSTHSRHSAASLFPQALDSGEGGRQGHSQAEVTSTQQAASEAPPTHTSFASEAKSEPVRSEPAELPGQRRRSSVQSLKFRRASAKFGAGGKLINSRDSIAREATAESSSHSHSTVYEHFVSYFTKRQTVDEKAQRQKRINKMLKHVEMNGQKQRAGSLLARALAADKSWMNAEAAILKETSSSKLPFRSLTFTSNAIDAVRLLKIFWLAVFVTSAGVINDTAEHTYIFATVWFIFSIVLVSNLVLDPYITYQFGLLSTLACVNPILVGETVEYVNDLRHLEERIARTVVERHFVHVCEHAASREDAEGALDVPEMSSESMQAYLKTAFKSWDVSNKGYIDQKAFISALQESKLHFSSRQCRALFHVIDPDFSGRIDYGEFTSQMGPLIRKEMLSLQIRLRIAHREVRQCFKFTLKFFIGNVQILVKGNEKTRLQSNEEGERRSKTAKKTSVVSLGGSVLTPSMPFEVNGPRKSDWLPSKIALQSMGGSAI